MVEKPETTKIFLSYSRSEFYFAESLALELIDAGFEVWFDVRELAPGEDWKDEIDRGVQESDVFLFVASDGSTNSGPCYDERFLAQKYNKPIYVALFEAVQWPPPADEWKNEQNAEKGRPTKGPDNVVSVVDLRGNFEKNFQRLVDALNDPAGSDLPQDRIPQPDEHLKRLPGPLRRWLSGIPSRVSPQIALIIFVLLLFPVFNVWFWIDVLNTPQELIGVAVAIAWVVYVLVQARAFLRRDFSYGEFLTALIISVLPIIWLYIPAIAVYWYLRSEAIYRWLPRGEAPEARRRRMGNVNPNHIRQAWKELERVEAPHEMRFHIHHSPADRRIAARIERGLASFGHKPVTEADAEEQIIVITNKTPLAMLKDFVNRYMPDGKALDGSNISPFLAANVSARRGGVSELGTYQQIDFRRQEKKQLESVGLMYRHPEHGKAFFGLTQLPLRSSTTIMPRGTRRYLALMRITIVLTILLALILLIPTRGDTTTT
ncbi:MAG: toll/interleukin-1 receptor domain-containing protein, partial [Chloroflexota bacterium]